MRPYSAAFALTQTTVQSVLIQEEAAKISDHEQDDRSGK
jgi:hypothetical protein